MNQSMGTRDLGRGFGRRGMNVGGVRRSAIVELKGDRVVLGGV